jgi:hypothetical protein
MHRVLLQPLELAPRDPPLAGACAQPRGATCENGWSGRLGEPEEQHDEREGGDPEELEERPAPGLTLCGEPTLE